MGEVANLFGTLGLRIDEGGWAQGDARIRKLQTAVAGLGGMESKKASEGLAKLGGEVGKAGEAAGRAGHSFDAAGAAIKGYLVYLGAHWGFEKLIKFNEDMQTSIISLSAMIQGSLGGSYKSANDQAQQLYAGWQKFSTKTPAQTSELLEFGKNIAAATFAAGGKVKDLQELTQQGIIAAKILAGNRGAGYASLEITELLMGNVSNRMMMARLLLGFVKMTEEQFRALDDKQRLATVKRALNSQAFVDATKAFSGSYAGVTSTMWDKINISLGKVGATLFANITKGVGGFNEWLDDHSAQIEEYGKKIGEFLGQAFEVVSAAIGIVVEKGGELLGWLGEFIDGGELVKAFLITLGALLTAFAIRSAIAFATNPITLVILAVTALIYAIRWLMSHPEQVREAFEDAFDAISDAMDATGEAIKTVFKAAFEFVRDLPVVKELIDLFEFFLNNAQPDEAQRKTMDEDHMSPDDLWKKYHPGATADPDAQPDRPTPASDGPTVRFLPASGQGSGPVAMNISVGDVNVHSPNADPVAVADQVRQVFHEELGGVLRSTMDQVA